MNLTDSEILELENLLAEQKIDLLNQGLVSYTEKTNKNYKFLHQAIINQEYDLRGELINGYRGVVLEGSSRSGKTWAGVDIIIWLCTIRHKNESLTINIYRETYNEFKTTLYEDFKRRLKDFNLDNPFERAKEIRSFKIGKSTISFLGDGKHGGGCDYAFYNEGMMIDREVFDQSEMRCRRFWWMDYNPSFTDHWVFDSVVPRFDVGFLRTTFLDNPFISAQEKNKILSYEPWEVGSYEVTEDDVIFNGETITDKNQPPPNIRNVNQGTADEFMWKVYGLGLRGAMKGVIFPNVHYIEEFPDMDYIYANDFGFTNDPNAFGKYTEDENNIWVEPLIYRPIDTPEELAETFEFLEVENWKQIVCDSSDKYTGENKGTVEMVSGLYDLGYTGAFKVRKNMSVMYHIGSMKKKRIHIVKNNYVQDGVPLWKHAKKEQENYKFKEINGIPVNLPEDKYNHIWDMARYGHMAWSEGEIVVDWD